MDNIEDKPEELKVRFEKFKTMEESAKALCDLMRKRYIGYRKFFEEHKDERYSKTPLSH